VTVNAAVNFYCTMIFMVEQILKDGALAEILPDHRINMWMTSE